MTILETINDYMYVACLFAVGSFSAFTFTSYCVVKSEHTILKNKIVNDKLKRERDEKASEEAKKIKQAEEESNSYENKYKLDKVIHNKNNCEIKEQNIFEATPHGVVIMEYDEEEKTFNYWSDKTISYKYLQVVARRFVTDYQCKDYYIQCDEKERKNHDSVKDKIKQPSDCVCENDDCKLTKPETETDKTDKTYKLEENDDSSLFIKNKTYTDNTVNIASNKYSHVGELKDYYGPVSKSNTSKNISFADFKKNNN